MKRLVLKRLIIISQKYEEARTIEFGKRLTVITGENLEGTTINRTGKSLVMKSIYHSLGAKLTKYTSNWGNLQISTILSFSYDGNEYEIYRDNDRFILNEYGNLFFFSNISELRKRFVDLFNFRIRMPINRDNDDVIYAYPGAIFMPFYIDQDKGWSGSWDSFRDIFNAKWKKEILLYHMGVRTPEYYDLLDERVELEFQKTENNKEEVTLKTVLKKHIEKYNKYLDINLDLNEFEHEISQLTSELNKQMDKRNEIKEELVKCFNEMREFDELYAIAEKVYNELLKDMDYVENDLREETIICPICSTPHENSVLNRFHIYSEIEECENTMQQYFKERNKIEKRIQKQSQELKTLDDYISKIDEILNRKREAITFRDIIVSEGSKSILDDLKEELTNIQNDTNIIDYRLKEIRKEQSAITRAGKHITNKYLERLKNYLDILNVVDIDEADVKKFKTHFNSGGNDLPSAILAQIFALYSVSAEHSETVSAPIILDAIFQQEPAKEKINTIWDFVINYQPVKSQLVISTTELHNREIEGKIIHLTKERGLLTSEGFIKEKEKIIKYKNELLNFLKEC
ncbi:hypothetical protein [Ornithinibacillus sp. FSL M8-0202]|uniref:hypothetical protein n=1 Tax=Ornithinibacillus sp. FSL M8-0202 TaxID=2921616 RepID=UPI0030CA8D2B